MITLAVLYIFVILYISPRQSDVYMVKMEYVYKELIFGAFKVEEYVVVQQLFLKSLFFNMCEIEMFDP